jgi:hypothetical protein
MPYPMSHDSLSMRPHTVAGVTVWGRAGPPAEAVGVTAGSPSRTPLCRPTLTADGNTDRLARRPPTRSLEWTQEHPPVRRLGLP